MVEAFVDDPSPDAYETARRPVAGNRPRWGEHRARYWLDAARYADTHGYPLRQLPRDCGPTATGSSTRSTATAVRRSSRSSSWPATSCPARTLDQQIASGFNRCNITTNEGGTIAEEYLVLYTRDRTETVSQVWLGLTAGCAVCHDHKFDPLTQREFYEMAAFFNNTTQGAKDGNIKDTPPIACSCRRAPTGIAGQLAERPTGR